MSGFQPTFQFVSAKAGIRKVSSFANRPSNPKDGALIQIQSTEQIYQAQNGNWEFGWQPGSGLSDISQAANGNVDGESITINGQTYWWNATKSEWTTDLATFDRPSPNITNDLNPEYIVQGIDVQIRDHSGQAEYIDSYGTAGMSYITAFIGSSDDQVTIRDFTSGEEPDPGTSKSFTPIELAQVGSTDDQITIRDHTSEEQIDIDGSFTVV